MRDSIVPCKEMYRGTPSHRSRRRNGSTGSLISLLFVLISLVLLSLVLILDHVCIIVIPYVASTGKRSHCVVAPGIVIAVIGAVLALIPVLTLKVACGRVVGCFEVR